MVPDQGNRNTIMSMRPEASKPISPDGIAETALSALIGIAKRSHLPFGCSAVDR
jgi:hypothetical protein